ncbi:uncharacterized protein LOC135804472 [Sycon ciliatum]|uniref:uncharacterized protein LOC135804472 n=1 Tax=Sycon ciliatum TaxID=27933 RepID=UPI0031F65D8D
MPSSLDPITGIGVRISLVVCCLLLISMLLVSSGGKYGPRTWSSRLAKRSDLFNQKHSTRPQSQRGLALEQRSRSEHQRHTQPGNEAASQRQRVRRIHRRQVVTDPADPTTASPMPNVTLQPTTALQVSADGLGAVNFKGNADIVGQMHNTTGSGWLRQEYSYENGSAFGTLFDVPPSQTINTTMVEATVDVAPMGTNTLMTFDISIVNGLDLIEGTAFRIRAVVDGFSFTSSFFFVAIFDDGILNSSESTTATQPTTNTSSSMRATTTIATRVTAASTTNDNVTVVTTTASTTNDNGTVVTTTASTTNDNGTVVTTTASTTNDTVTTTATNTSGQNVSSGTATATPAMVMSTDGSSDTTPVTASEGATLQNGTVPEEAFQDASSDSTVALASSIPAGVAAVLALAGFVAYRYKINRRGSVDLPLVSYAVERPAAKMPIAPMASFEELDENGEEIYTSAVYMGEDDGDTQDDIYAAVPPSSAQQIQDDDSDSSVTQQPGKANLTLLNLTKAAAGVATRHSLRSHGGMSIYSTAVSLDGEQHTPTPSDNDSFYSAAVTVSPTSQASEYTGRYDTTAQEHTDGENTAGALLPKSTSHYSICTRKMPPAKPRRESLSSLSTSSVYHMQCIVAEAAEATKAKGEGKRAASRHNSTPVSQAEYDALSEILNVISPPTEHTAALQTDDRPEPANKDDKSSAKMPEISRAAQAPPEKPGNVIALSAGELGLEEEVYLAPRQGTGAYQSTREKVESRTSGHGFSVALTLAVPKKGGTDAAAATAATEGADHLDVENLYAPPVDENAIGQRHNTVDSVGYMAPKDVRKKINMLRASAAAPFSSEIYSDIPLTASKLSITSIALSDREASSASSHGGASSTEEDDTRDTKPLSAGTSSGVCFRDQPSQDGNKGNVYRSVDKKQRKSSLRHKMTLKLKSRERHKGRKDHKRSDSLKEV